MSRAWPLLDQDRLQALTDLGLTEASDPGMERYARRVRDQLGVPVSLVSLVRADQQIFPGMCGLPEPWAERRATPLSHSFCQHVVAAGEPLVIEDAREDDLVRENLATTEIGVVAYAGMPLSDDDGNVLGSLCAIDTQPRRWTEEELTLLRDAALDCSQEIRLRLSRLDAERERARLQLAAARAVRLLGIAESLNRCRTVLDVRQELRSFVDASTGLIDATLYLDEDRPPAIPLRGDVGPSGIVVVADLAQDDADLPSWVLERLRELGARAVGFLPVRGASRQLAVVELVWDVPRVLDPDEHAMASALGAYTGQALERALLLEDRISVAHELQSAMLTTLPETAELDLAACYLPANAGEEVGGDWFDALVLPTPADARGRRSMLVSVGDVTGHDIAAASTMGQVRAMLRQATSDHPGAAPSELLARLERSCQAFGLAATGTAVIARLDPHDDGRSWTLSWTSAGHPPPIVVDAHGGTTLLHGHDLLFGHPDLLTAPRRDHAVVLEPGSHLVLYTDGVTDAAAVDPDDQVDRLVEVVAKNLGGAQGVIDAVEATFTGMADDVVAVAVRIPWAAT